VLHCLSGVAVRLCGFFLFCNFYFGNSSTTRQENGFLVREKLQSACKGIDAQQEGIAPSASVVTVQSTVRECLWEAFTMGRAAQPAQLRRLSAGRRHDSFGLVSRCCLARSPLPVKRRRCPAPRGRGSGAMHSTARPVATRKGVNSEKKLTRRRVRQNPFRWSHG
jgi:hypothetical protein